MKKMQPSSRSGIACIGRDRMRPPAWVVTMQIAISSMISHTRSMSFSRMMMASGSRTMNPARPARVPGPPDELPVRAWPALAGASMIGRRSSGRAAMTRDRLRRVAAALAAALLLAIPARAADPIKVGFTMALTGGVAPNGKQSLAAFEIWRDDVNARGGLLGRPVELVYYDDQSNPANVPALYTKLITVDKVDLVIGPYATNMVAPAMPVLMQNNKMTISILALGVNKQFNYPRYFSTVPLGPEGPPAFSKGFFELATAQSPRPQTVAIVAADAEFAKTASDGARQNASAAGFKIVYDGKYPPSTTEFSPMMRAVQAANADIVFAAAYPPDTVGIVRA